MNWSEYYRRSLDRPVHPNYALLEPHLDGLGDAIELGCGVGNGVLWLLERGLHVIAVDNDNEALQIVEGRLPDGADCHLVGSMLENLALPDVDVVVAQFSLFFMHPKDFPATWDRIVASIRPGGLFMGQFLGPDDDWAEREYVTHTAQQVSELLQNFSILHREEVNRDGLTLLDEPKHWHVHHVIARKSK
ncbi:MAG: class I SAM-dependent methyltransferase [Chthonomonas sp.]|nr:class I SAM-dependent methyltransferase [Chthonomonas sp.]